MLTSRGSILALVGLILASGYGSVWAYDVEGVTDLSLINPAGRSVRAINDYGYLAGISEVSDQAFLWIGGEELTELGTLGGDWSSGNGVNDQGQVVGWAETIGPEYHERAFIWDNGEMTDLGTLGGDWSEAYGINDLGQVVGAAEVSIFNYHAFLWEDGVMTDLNTMLPPDSSWSNLERAYDINNLGQVVGLGETTIGETHAFVYDPIDGFFDLGDVGGTFDHAYGINDNGVIVGTAEVGAESHAFIWDNYWGNMIDINNLLPPDSEWDYMIAAYDINNHDQVVGLGETSSGQFHSFQLTVTWTPEPMACGMLALGGLLLARRRKRHTQRGDGGQHQ